MIGNVLVTDIAYLAQNVYDVTETDYAWVVYDFGVGAGLGGIIDGILLLGFVIFGIKSFMAYAVICVMQGFTFNGMTTLNPIMVTR